MQSRIVASVVRVQVTQRAHHVPCRALSVYNSLSKSYCELKPRDATLTWYACGPTVYDSAHIGHARTYVTLDIMRRLVERLLAHPVRYCMGITDVDDKIIARARERNVPPAQLARHYESEFMDDMARLGVRPPTMLTRVTDHIPEIVAYISRILDNKLAYTAADGVYLDTTALGPRYGALAPSIIGDDDAESASAAAPADEDGRGDAVKRNKRDCALWKLAKPGEPTWDSPWGPGRPGWHVECSAMTHAVFGRHLDVHAGGVDLAFPHHCNEIAQCNAHNLYTGAAGDSGWAQVFMHTGHVHIAGLKMSKSLKNFISIGSMMEERGGDAATAALEFRLFCLSHKYRSNVSFSYDRLDDARALLRKVRDCLSAVATATASTRRPSSPPAPPSPSASSTGLSDASASTIHIPAPSSSAGLTARVKLGPQDFALLDRADTCRVQVMAALHDDLDTPTALRHVMDLCSALVVAAVPGGATTGALLHASAVIRDFCDMVGLHVDTRGTAGADSDAAAAVAALQSFADFRHEVRTSAVACNSLLKRMRKEGTMSAAEGSPGSELAQRVQQVLHTCDNARDVTFPKHGWTLKDAAAGPQLTRTSSSS